MRGREDPIIEDEFIESHLDRQLEVYLHTQVRAEKLVQLIIAAAAVVITFASSDLVDRLINALGSVELTTDTVFIYGIGQGANDVLELAPVVSAFLFFISVISLFDSLLWAADILDMPKLRPHLESSVILPRKPFLLDSDEIKELGHNWKDSDRENLKSDIKYNILVIDGMKKGLRRAYQTLAMSLALFMITAFSLTTLVTESIFVTVGISVTIALILSIIFSGFLLLSLNQVYRELFPNPTVNELITIAKKLISRVKKIESSIHFISIIGVFYFGLGLYSSCIAVTIIWLSNIPF